MTHVAAGPGPQRRRPERPALPPVATDRTQQLVLLGAVAWVLLLVVLQLNLGGRLVVVPWLALGPLVASLVLSWRGTSVSALVSVAAVVWLTERGGDLGEVPGVVRIAGSAALALFAVVSASVRVRRELRIRQVTEVATVSQAVILHPVPTQVGRLVLASRYASASTHAQVGGDLFDVVAVGTGVRLVIGDARGKGLEALHASSAVLSAFRHTAPQSHLGLDEVARAIDAAVTPALAAEDFVTAVLCEVHADGRLDLVLCGHPAPLRLRPGHAPEEVGTSVCPPFGLGVEPVVDRTVLEGGDRLLLYTDGLVEARDRDGAFFDLVAAATGLTSSGRAAASSLDGALERLMTEVREHVGGRLTDDVAALLVQPIDDLPAASAQVPAAVGDAAGDARRG